MSGPVVSIFSMMIFLFLLIVPVAIGIALLITSRRGGLGYPACGACKYNLSATVGTAVRCPECGAQFTEAGILPPRGPKRTLRLWVGLALMILPLTCVGLAVVPLFAYSSQSAVRARAAAAQVRQQAITAQQQTAAQSRPSDDPAIETDDPASSDTAPPTAAPESE